MLCLCRAAWVSTEHITHRTMAGLDDMYMYRYSVCFVHRLMRQANPPQYCPSYPLVTEYSCSHSCVMYMYHNTIQHAMICVHHVTQRVHSAQSPVAGWEHRSMYLTVSALWLCTEIDHNPVQRDCPHPCRSATPVHRGANLRTERVLSLP